MIDETRIRDWLAAYRHAWTTDDPDEVGAAVRRRHPLLHRAVPPPLEGVDGGADYWLGEQRTRIPWSSSTGCWRRRATSSSSAR